MIQWIQRCLPGLRTVSQPEVVLFAHVPIRANEPSNRDVRSRVDCSPTAGVRSNAKSKRPKPIVSVSRHRERLLAMDLAHLKICNSARCVRLKEAGIETAGDLLVCRVRTVCHLQGWSRRAEATIGRMKAAVRLASNVESMTPRDALLLIAIHRRSAATLAREHAATLHRDLERFSLSTRGSRLVGRRGIPSLRRVKLWIEACRTVSIPVLQTV